MTNALTITHVTPRTNDWIAEGDSVILSNGVAAVVTHITIELIEDESRTSTDAYGIITVRTARGNTITIIE